jgi:D-glycero-alpha-D-manno-heptose-7-phosphate kinase
MKARKELAYRTSLRVDIAGGTLDLAPIHLFHLPCFTVNLAIGVDAIAHFKPLEGAGRWLFRSLDSGSSLEWNRDAPIERAEEAGAGLVARTVSNVFPDVSGEIITAIEAPKGAGLGGSSALVAALVVLGFRLRRTPLDPDRIVRTAQAIETVVIGMPAGCQDYIAAIWGGGSIVEFALEGWKRTAIPARFARILNQHLLIAYAGKPHFSGANNWALYRAFFDGDATTRRFFERLAHNSREMAEAVANRDLAGVAQWMNRDWEDRKAVLTEMSTPEIEAVTTNVRSAGASAARVCGAGGGGAVAFMVPPVRRGACVTAAEEAGALVIDAGSGGDGLREVVTWGDSGNAAR